MSNVKETPMTIDQNHGGVLWPGKLGLLVPSSFRLLNFVIRHLLHRLILPLSGLHVFLRGHFAGLFHPLGLALTLAASGCSLLHSSGSQPKAEVRALRLGTNQVGAALTLTVLQAKVMRFADEYVAKVAQAADDLS